MTLSLKDEILERLNLRKGGQKTASANIRKASRDFSGSAAPQFKGKSQKKRHQMAVAAGLSAARGESAVPKSGDKMIYEGKQILVQSINESGMAVIKFANRRAPLIVRAADLQQPTQLNEGFFGMAPITPTYRDAVDYGFVKLDGLDPEDIGLRLYEDEDEEPDDNDGQEEDHDNGSNVRQDGHSGKVEVDELPTPSDTIAPAYTDEKPPKEISDPLVIQTGAEEAHLWDKPNWDGYDYPADAPEIPTADFEGSEMGNSRAPHFNADEHQAGDGQENRESDDDEDERTDENYLGFNKLENRLSGKKGMRNPGAVAASIGRKKYGKKNFQSHAAQHQKFHEQFSFVTEEGGEAERYSDFMDKGGTHDDYMSAGGNVTPGVIPSPNGMGSAMNHLDNYGTLNAARGGNGPTEIPGGAQPKSDQAYSPNAATPIPGGWRTTMAKPGPDSGKPNSYQGYGVGGGAFSGMPRASAAAPPQVPHYGPNLESAAIMAYKRLLSEMDDMLGDEDREPNKGDTITLTLPAMASIVCTVAHKVGQDQELMRSMVEALAEIGHGKTIDMPDLDAVAAHMNGEETQEIENRDAGRPEHEGIPMNDHESSGHPVGSEWPGDGEKSRSGKTKLMGGADEYEVHEDYFGSDDVVAETLQPSDVEEIRTLRRRAGFRQYR